MNYQELLWTILILSIFSNWVTHWFSPFNWFREKLIEAYTRFCIRKEMFAFQQLAIVISCPKCFGFWFTLFYKQDFWLALAVSFVAYLIKFVIDKIELWYEKS